MSSHQERHNQSCVLKKKKRKKNIDICPICKRCVEINRNRKIHSQTFTFLFVFSSVLNFLCFDLTFSYMVEAAKLAMSGMIFLRSPFSWYTFSIICDSSFSLSFLHINCTHYLCISSLWCVDEFLHKHWIYRQMYSQNQLAKTSDGGNYGLQTGGGFKKFMAS